MKQPRVGIYEPWGGNIDEGWTRWILEQFHFPFTRLHNADIQAGHLRDQFDTIVIAEMGTRQIMDGMRPGTVPGQYAGGIGEEGAQALRDFVTAGGTLVTLGQRQPVRHRSSSTWPVTNVVAGVCGRTSSSAPARCCARRSRSRIIPSWPGCRRRSPVMFERNPVFDTRPGFRGKVLASYIEGPQSADERLPAGRGTDRRQSRRARCELRHRAHHHARLPAAVARPIARHL